MDLAEIGQLREEAVALTKKGQDLFISIQKGDEPFEKMEEAQKWVDEGGRKMALAKQAEMADAQLSALVDGQGSLTAGGNGGERRMGDELPGDEPEKKWQPFGEFALAIMADKYPNVGSSLVSKGKLPADAVERLRREQVELKTLAQEGLGSAGGFLVPVPYIPELFYKAWENAIVRPRARIIPMTTRQVQMPTLDQTITPANQKSAFFAGVNVEWIEEGESKPETELKFKLVTLTAHELAAYLPVTNNLIEDSAISIDAMLRQILPAACTDAEDWWFFNGNGAGVPQGVISAPCTIQVARAGATAIVWADVIKMLHAFEPGDGVWVIQICAMEQILQLKDANSNYMWIPNMRDGMPERLMGYPIKWTEKVPALGTKGDIGLYDFGYYLIGDRRAPTLEMSDDYLFRYNQRAYRLSERVDGQPWLSAPVKLRPAGASSISPFVVLNTYGA